jgi:hypothetical protein
VEGAGAAVTTVFDFHTRNSHYRLNVEAQTIERISPDPFPPRIVARGAGALEPGADLPYVGLRYFAVWADPKPDDEILHTTRVLRVEATGRMP